MNEDLANLHYSPILNYNYAQWFEEVQYNGNTLSTSEREEFIKVIDETISQYADGLPKIHVILHSPHNKIDEYNRLEHTIVSVMLFVLITMIDSMVASKYFILADGDYDKRFMRGKLMVILNEGFKRLYGFDEKTHKKSEWDRLLPLMGYFPEIINHQYQELTFLLEKHARSFSWWKEERDLETHIWHAEKLYDSRQKEVVESKVMMDTMKLFTTLFAVNNFLTNVHACVVNYLIGQYRCGKLKKG